MTETTIQQRLSLPGAQWGEYLGVETPLSFGDSGAELRALRSACGVFDLGWRARITASGKDRTRWLHNMVTNNVRDLAQDRGNYNFVLNAQGRILGDLCIFNRGETFILQTDRKQVEPLLTAIKRFIIMDKVELAESGGLAAIGVCGPQAGTILAAAGFDVNGMEPLEVRTGNKAFPGAEIIRGGQSKPGWYEIWCEPASAQSLWDSLVKAGANPVGANALERWRILQGVPQYGQDIRDRDLPQETGQTQALNFNKGCYIGQEIVERIRSRGQVHRQFTGFEFEGDPAPPGKYESDGRLLAEITSTAVIPVDAGEKRIGLGYVRRETAEAGPHVDLNGHRARIVALPFAI
jgi:folate-binding protein YgfZ